MKAKQQTKNEKKKPLRKLPDLAVKKDVRGGGILISKPIDSSSPDILK